MKGIIVTAKNEMRMVDYDPPHYDVIKEAVGGWYEHVKPRRLKRPYCMMVNEEGLLLRLPTNDYGCYLYDTLSHGAPIVGDIMILKDGYHDGEPDVVGMDEDEARTVADEIIEITGGLVHWAEKGD